MNTRILDMFEDAKERGTYLRISAPMVRYSKLPFRLLVKRHGVDVVHTPMILANCFHKSALARAAEIQTCSEDRPLVVQFAASNAMDLRRAAELVTRYVDGVDLNCGCPQPWAIQEHIGAYWMSGNWEDLSDMLKQTRQAITCPLSVKIRVLEEETRMVELVRRLEAAGVSWITVHGRTRTQKSTEPVNTGMIRVVKQSVRIPVVYNGNIFTLRDADQAHALTSVDGIMAARGLLQNPLLFEGRDLTWSTIDEFVDLAISYGMTTPLMHHHLSAMIESLVSPSLLKHFNTLTSVPSLLDFIQFVK